MSIPITLTILIPVYNESKHITQVLESIYQLPEIANYEVIVINDGSTDGTHLKITEWSTREEKNNFIYLKSELNQGKTGAIKRGILKAQGKYSIIQDGDLEYDVNDISRLVKSIDQDKLDAVIGYRRKKFQKINILDATLKSGVVLLTLLFNILYKTKFKDLSGGYKIFKTEALKAITLEERGFTFCYEVVIKLLKLKKSIGQIDINYSARDKSAGKKIGLMDGYYCFCTILKLYRR
jgi:glycosyltransferase involved in cell wall biosynthesis